MNDTRKSKQSRLNDELIRDNWLELFSERARLSVEDFLDNLYDIEEHKVYRAVDRREFCNTKLSLIQFNSISQITINRPSVIRKSEYFYRLYRIILLFEHVKV